MNSPDKRLLVGMSGGIDSTATCLMLKEQGYEIVGLTMWVWGDEPAPNSSVRAKRILPFMIVYKFIVFFLLQRLQK